MESKYKNITKEQQEWRNSILNKKKQVKDFIAESVIRQVLVTEETDDKIIDKLYYLTNCIFWIEEYRAKRTTKERCILAIKSIGNLSKELEIIVTT